MILAVYHVLVKIAEPVTVMKKAITRLIDWSAFPYSLILLLKNPGISGKTKLKAGLIFSALLLYLLSPADLIPDVAPFLGWLDDAAAIGVAMMVAERAVPEINIRELEQKARNDVKHVLFLALAVAAAMILITLFTLGLLIYLAIKFW